MSSHRLHHIDRTGPPDIIHKDGTTRYKYDHGIWIEEIWNLNAMYRKHGRRKGDPDYKNGKFYVFQAGVPSRFLGEAETLIKAKQLAEAAI